MEECSDFCKLFPFQLKTMSNTFTITILRTDLENFYICEIKLQIKTTKIQAYNLIQLFST